MEPMCHQCHERPFCPESLTGMCWKCLRAITNDLYGDKAWCCTSWETFRVPSDRPIDYPSSEKK
jgi:hypothetical protein